MGRTGKTRLRRGGAQGAGGFSLLEMLVVIAIIGVLIALLLLALSGVQEQARRMKCLSHLQQMGEVLHMYGHSHKDVLPLMPVPAGVPVVQNQWRYGGLAGLFSLRQVGDGQSLGYGGGTPAGLAYSDGTREPLLESYVSRLDFLVCPSDREDRYYGDPYSPSGNTSYAAAIVKYPRRPGKSADVISYQVSYAFVAGRSLPRGYSNEVVFFDESNGPDLGPHSFYGMGQSPGGGATPNSTAAGAAGAGHYGPRDNHKAEGGNVLYTGGSAKWAQGPPRQWLVGLEGKYVID